jgi:hypothetical protein
VVRGPAHLLQCAAAAGAHRIWTLDGAAGDDGRGLAIARVAGRGQCSEEGCFTPIGSNGFYSEAGERRCSTSSPWRRPRWSRPASKPARDRRSAVGGARAPGLQLVLGQNHLQQPLYDATTGGCPRRTSRRSLQTRTKARNQRSPFCSHSRRCARPTGLSPHHPGKSCPWTWASRAPGPPFGSSPLLKDQRGGETSEAPASA